MDTQINTGTQRIVSLESDNIFQHAEHNKRVCDFLSKKGEFPDWVVITAFYSAMHFVLADALPYKGKNDVVSTTLLEYKINELNHDDKNNVITDHQATKTLVFNAYGIHVSQSYNKLYETCWKVRYKDNKIKPNDASFCRTELEYVIRNMKKYKVHP